MPEPDFVSGNRSHALQNKPLHIYIYIYIDIQSTCTCANAIYIYIHTYFWLFLCTYICMYTYVYIHTSLVFVLLCVYIWYNINVYLKQYPTLLTSISYFTSTPWSCAQRLPRRGCWARNVGPWRKSSCRVQGARPCEAPASCSSWRGPVG